MEVFFGEYTIIVEDTLGGVGALSSSRNYYMARSSARSVFKYLPL
jgi:hypothetical protein